jgi:hypothetical protein
MTESEFTEAWCAVCVHCRLIYPIERHGPCILYVLMQEWADKCLCGNDTEPWMEFFQDDTCSMFHPDPFRFRTRACSAREPREYIFRWLWAEQPATRIRSPYAYQDLIMVGNSIHHKALTLYYGRQA